MPIFYENFAHRRNRKTHEEKKKKWDNVLLLRKEIANGFAFCQTRDMNLSNKSESEDMSSTIEFEFNVVLFLVLGYGWKMRESQFFFKLFRWDLRNQFKSTRNKL